MSKLSAILFFLLQTVFSGSSFANSATEVGYNISPAFIEGQRVWAIKRDDNAMSYRAVYSDNWGDSWSAFGNAIPFEPGSTPSSLFVHTSGHIFVAESAVACKGSRIFRINRSTGEVIVATYTDPTATIHPWGWTQDALGNLWAGEYGLPGSGHPECAPSQPVNVSYVLKVADVNGVPLARDITTKSNWMWPRTDPISGMASWLAPKGAAADLHIHNLRFDSYHNRFLINSGDSPRTFMSWAPMQNGALDTSIIPNIVDACCDDAFLLTGFTGLAPMIDGAYVGDDWTSQGRGNSIRLYPWSNNSSSGMGAPIKIATMPSSYDTPIWDLHGSGENELWFVNFDEPTSTEPSIRLSGLHKITRASSGSPFSGNVETVYSAQSSWRNSMYIATDYKNRIPLDAPYIFVYGIYSGATPADKLSVLTRVSR